ncbi:hypothetical protein [Antrihabitans spumae]|uniref:Uncharacterized protein n=1 Tax=Antrihabitans spumae TaxID=3373370 RepID=A0ABW7KNU3_9NOCA
MRQRADVIGEKATAGGQWGYAPYPIALTRTVATATPARLRCPPGLAAGGTAIRRSRG